MHDYIEPHHNITLIALHRCRGETQLHKYMASEGLQIITEIEGRTYFNLFNKTVN